jgi:AraC-like DNA-binding protein
MGVLRDTRDLPVAERTEALHAALLSTSGASRVELRPHDDEPRGLLSLTQLGEASVFTAACNGVRLVRDARAAAEGFDDVVAIAVHGSGVGRHSTPDGQRFVRTGELMMVDLTRPFDFAWDGPGSSAALQVPRALLGLSVDDVHRAAGRLTQSHLHDLLRDYLQSLAAGADQVGGSPGSPLVATSTVQLVRALLADVTERPHLQGDVAETLPDQVRAYIRGHLREPDLGPDEIARALAVSRRQLFRACRAAELSIEQHIIELRLQGARRQLEADSGSATVASVAYAWGFKDADHFGRRFRAAFGMSPAVWRASRSETRPAR